ncbi:hypothetical protein GF323_00210 [Candidatus Woesearchaeota archaeon]|nr:hypothetical protein [Candidatus Woesearchaeota archaeon]
MRTGLNLPKESTFKGPALIWKRAAAFAIDLLIIDFIIAFPFRSIMEKLIPAGSFMESYSYISSNPKVAGILSLITLLIGILALLYFSILEYSQGQTPGKMLMRIKVEPVRDKNFFAYLVRSMYMLIIFPFILLWVIDPLFMFFTQDRRRLSEILSGTKTTEVYALR